MLMLCENTCTIPTVHMYIHNIMYTYVNSVRIPVQHTLYIRMYTHANTVFEYLYNTYCTYVCTYIRMYTHVNSMRMPVQYILYVHMYTHVNHNVCNVYQCIPIVQACQHCVEIRIQYMNIVTQRVLTYIL